MNKLEQMCRACMCKNQKFYSIYDKEPDNPLRIYEIFATTIPQVPIHINDELTKKICVACLNILRIIHKFQQMCIASDTYMRSLLVSTRLTNNSITKQQVEIEHMVMGQEAEKINSPLIAQNQLKSPCSIKEELDDDAGSEPVLLKPTEGDNDPMDSVCREDEYSPLIKFEANEVIVQECDLKISMTTRRKKSKKVILEYREAPYSVSITTKLGSNYNSEGNTTTASAMSAADEAPNVQFHRNPKLATLSEIHKYKCYFCKVEFGMDSQLENNGLKSFLCDHCNKDPKLMFIESPWATPCLVLNNYLYNCQIRKNNIEYWRCHNYSKKQQSDRCRSRCVLENGKLKKFTGGTHNHLPHTEKIEKLVTRNRMLSQISGSNSGVSCLKFGPRPIPLEIQLQQRHHIQQPQQNEEKMHSSILLSDD